MSPSKSLPLHEQLSILSQAQRFREQIAEKNLTKDELLNLLSALTVAKLSQEAEINRLRSVIA